MFNKKIEFTMETTASIIFFILAGIGVFSIIDTIWKITH